MFGLHYAFVAVSSCTNATCFSNLGQHRAPDFVRLAQVPHRTHHPPTGIPSTTAPSALRRRAHSALHRTICEGGDL